jgi:hypothetical protein
MAEICRIESKKSRAFRVGRVPEPGRRQVNNLRPQPWAWRLGCTDRHAVEATLNDFVHAQHPPIPADSSSTLCRQLQRTLEAFLVTKLQTERF